MLLKKSILLGICNNLYKMSIILGINKDHSDSSACLLINGKLVGAVAEERLGKRLKHDSIISKKFYPMVAEGPQILNIQI